MFISLVAAAASALTLAHGSFTHGIDAFTSTRSAAPRVGLDAPWCGDGRTTDDVADQVDNGRFRYHAILAVPAGAPSRLRDVAPELQADARSASALLERVYGKAIRFDWGTNCGGANLDIAVLNMHADANALRAAADKPNGTMSLLYNELAAAHWPVSNPSSAGDQVHETNYVVWLDGPSPPGACGQATLFDDPRRIPTNRNNMGGSVAAVFRDGDGFCDSDAVRHEIGHTLGAVQPHAAPNADETGHCGDAFEDTMCLASAPHRGGGHFQGEYMDYGNDDYWDPPNGPPLAWWTANLSRFLCDAGCNGAEPVAAPVPGGAPVARAAVKPTKKHKKHKKRKTKRARRHARTRRFRV